MWEGEAAMHGQGCRGRGTWEGAMAKGAFQGHSGSSGTSACCQGGPAPGVWPLLAV